MTALLMERPVAKPKDTTIRVHMDTAELLRQVAALRRTSVADYLASVIEPIAQRDLVAEAERIARNAKAPRKTKD